MPDSTGPTGSADSPESQRSEELRTLVLTGLADDDELAEFFGPDLMNQLANQWRDENHTRRLFTAWYVDVMGPLGIEPAPAFAMFKGETTINDFVGTLDEALLDDFLERFPALQEEHQTRIENGEVR